MSDLDWYLEDVSQADKDNIEEWNFDIYGETEQGADGVISVDLRELCGEALARIKMLEEFREKAFEAHPNIDADIEFLCN